MVFENFQELSMTTDPAINSENYMACKAKKRKKRKNQKKEKRKKKEREKGKRSFRSIFLSLPRTSIVFKEDTALSS